MDNNDIKNINEIDRCLVQLETSWFYSNENEFKGPLSDEEIIQCLNRGDLVQTDLLWSKKHDMWVSVSQVEKFANILKSSELNSSKINTTNADNFNWANSDEFWSYIRSNHKNLNLKNSYDQDLFEPAVNESKNTKPAGLAIAVGFAVSVLLSLMLYKEFKPEYSHQYLNKDQNKDADLVIKSSLSRSGVRTKSFIVQQEAQRFKLVVATNLPEESVVEIDLNGQSETLVGGFKSQIIKQSKVKNGFAIYDNLFATDDQPLLQGEYVLSIRCVKCSDYKFAEKGILYKNQLFLGGQKNSQYDIALTQYHTQLRNETRRELEVFNQLDEALSQQLKSYLEQSKNKLKKPLLWSSFYDSWAQFQIQLQVEMQKLNERNSKGYIFYDNIIVYINNNFQIVKNIEEISKNDNSSPAKLASVKKFWENSAIIKKMTSDASQIPLSSNGMPRKPF